MDTILEKDEINTKTFVKMLSNRYVEGTGASKHDPLISPLFASDADLVKLPPHWTSIGGFDMLRDHGERMTAKIQKAGVQVVMEVHHGQQHVMELMVGKAPEANASIASIGEWVRRVVRAWKQAGRRSSTILYTSEPMVRRLERTARRSLFATSSPSPFFSLP